MYINSDLSVVRTKMMIKYVLSLRKPSPSGSPQKRERTERTGGQLATHSPRGFCVWSSASARSTSQSQVSFKKYPPEVAVINCVPMGIFASGMKKLPLRHYTGMFLIRDQRTTFPVSHKHRENVLLWHFNSSNSFVCN